MHSILDCRYCTAVARNIPIYSNLLLMNIMPEFVHHCKFSFNKFSL